MEQAADKLAESFGADKVDAMFHEATRSTLVALGTSRTPMGVRQHELGLDYMPIANGGRAVEVFESGNPHRSGRVDEDPNELPGLIRGLGIRSEIIVPLEVDGQRRGVLLASSSEYDAFSDEDLRFLETVARWVGVVAHRAELTQRMTEAAAEQARRLTAEELVTVLAHDLRNHLAAASARIQLVQRAADRQQRPDDVASTALALEALGRINAMIADLLDVSRLERGTFAISRLRVELTELIREAVATFDTARREIRLAICAERVPISIDPGRIRQAIENLIRNAIEHADEGTPVVVRVGSEMRPGGAWALVTVSNEGPEIPAELRSRLFAPFVAGSGSLGLGLGLYIASRIAAVHGGALSVSPGAGQGACFQLSLPVDASAAVQPLDDGPGVS
jgi:signal transduction histidine kinase